MAAPQKDQITCHVLDTVTGRPAADLAVVLRLLSPKREGGDYAFAKWTNSDGRIITWDYHGPDYPELEASEYPARKVIEMLEQETQTWQLTFQTGDYFGEGKTFWPQVDITFTVKKGESYHVPLLLGPWSYTTYRGS